MRRDIREWRDEVALRSPRQADYRISVLSALLSYGMADGVLLSNPASNIKRLYRGDRSEHIWTAADIAAFEAVASLPMRVALHLAHDLGQREGDLVRLPCSAYANGRITLRQSKRRPPHRRTGHGALP